MSDVVLSLGGLTPKELGMKTLRKSQRPILPPTVDRVLTIPGMHGAYDFGADMGPRPSDLDCVFLARNSFELQQRISVLAAHLVDGDGRPRTMPLVFSATPDRNLMVRYNGNLPIDRIAGLGTFTLPLIAYDPFFYQTEDAQQTATWDTDMSWDTDVEWGDDYSFEITGPQTMSINNYGSLNARPTIEITGNFNSLSLTVGGKNLTYSAPMSGTLVLDFALRTIKHNGINVIGNSNGVFGALPVGWSDVIVDGSGINVLMDINFRAKYPG